MIHQISHDSKLFNIRLDSESGLGYETVRPIIRNSIGAFSCLGPKFSGIISLEQTFSELQAEITDDVPVILKFQYVQSCRKYLLLSAFLHVICSTNMQKDSLSNFGASEFFLYSYLNSDYSCLEETIL